MKFRIVTFAFALACSQAFAGPPEELIGAWTTADVESDSVTRIDIYYTGDGKYFTTTFSDNGDVLTQGGYYSAKNDKIVFADISNDPEKRVEVEYALSGGVLKFTGGTMDMTLERDTRKSPLEN